MIEFKNVSKTYNNVTNLNGSKVWSDNNYCYYSNETNQYIFENSIWKEKIWDGLLSFDGNYVWTDGINYYYSKGSEQYIFLQ